MNKYNARKTEIDGITFHSSKEAKRYIELKNNTNISDINLQVKYELIPKQVDEKGKVIERACNYIADFTYYDNGNFIVEDTKGMRLPDYIIKRKLMLYKYGIRINEI